MQRPRHDADEIRAADQKFGLRAVGAILIAVIYTSIFFAFEILFKNG